MAPKIYHFLCGRYKIVWAQVGKRIYVTSSFVLPEFLVGLNKVNL